MEETMNQTCKHLRAKAMFIPTFAPPAADEVAEYQERPSHCWCNCTMTETGPDDRPVGRQRCNASRPCFEE
jgi:hypothetical protein